jgi:hypothetical protein
MEKKARRHIQEVVMTEGSEILKSSVWEEDIGEGKTRYVLILSHGRKTENGRSVFDDHFEIPDVPRDCLSGALKELSLSDAEIVRNSITVSSPVADEPQDSKRYGVQKLRLH